MSAAELATVSPVVSDSESVPESVEMQDTVQAVLASLPGLDAADLVKVMKAALAAVEKKTKGSKTAAVTKKGSMPKGVVPPQLRKPRAWVEFVYKHALENGWEAFTVYQTRKNKVTGEELNEEIEMSRSVLHDGAYVYEDSVTEKTPSGKQLIQKDAMSLSKHYWAPKAKTGTRPDLYDEFLAQYVEEPLAADNTSETSSKKTVVRLTAAEKEAAAEAKKAAKEAEKAAKKAEKEAEKEAKKAEKEAEKAAKKAEKEAEKSVKKTTKAPAKTVVPAAAVKKADVAPTPAAPAATPVKTVTKPAVKVAPKKEEWSCPADGMVHPWSYKGKQYLRNSDNEVWLREVDGGCGSWQGIYMPTEDRIDDSVPEPEFEDEE